MYQPNDPAWKRIKSAKDTESEEEKSLWQKEIKNDSKYPYRYMVVWQWSGCQTNRKTMWDKEKVFRLYECININGWNKAA